MAKPPSVFGHSDFLAARAAPGEPEEDALLRAATQDGKQAYRGYVKTATARRAAQISGIVPDAFQE